MSVSHDTAIIGDTPLWKVAAYIAGKIGEVADATCLPKTRDFIRQNALNGTLRIWGKKQLSVSVAWKFDTCLLEIPRDFWSAHKLTAVAFATKEPRKPLNANIPYTLPVEFDASKPKGWEDSYADLHVNSAQVRAIWEMPTNAGTAHRRRQHSRKRTSRKSPEKLRADKKSFIMPLLAKKGWPIHRWADEANVDSHTVHGYLNSTRKTYVSTLKKLAGALQIDVDQLPK